MTWSRRAVLVLAVALLATALLLASTFSPSPTLEESTYGYSVSMDTNAMLSNVTMDVPLPVSETGQSGIVEAVRAGEVDAPTGWEVDVAGTVHGTMLRVTADEVPAARRPDGNRYSTYLIGVSAPAADRIDTAAPYGREPTIATEAGRTVRPCPNVADPDVEKTCYAFERRAYVAYDTPPNTAVSVYVVHNGVNTYVGPKREMYYERMEFTLRGPQDGWVVAEGFASIDGAPSESVSE